jgi:hypothetical protein
MITIYRLSLNYFGSATENAGEWKSSADSGLVLMTIPLVEIDNEPIFSLSGEMIGCHATCTRSKLMHGGDRIKLQTDLT